MSTKQLRVVVGDRGGWNALEPPLRLALEEGYEVVVHLSATCEKQHRKDTLKLDERFQVIPAAKMPAGEFTSRDHHLTIVGSSQSKEGAQAAAGAIKHSRAPIIVVEDLYGSSLPMFKLLDTTAQLRKIRKVCVTTDFSRHLLWFHFPNPDKQLEVTGGPQFDKTFEVRQQWDTHRQRLRTAMKVDDETLVFLIAGQLNGTAEIMALVHSATLEPFFTMGKRVVLLVRQHPRATQIDSTLVDAMCVLRPKESFVDVVRDLAPAAEDLLPGVDFVLSGYSTTNFYAILYGMLGIVYVGTPAYRWDLLREKGLHKPPEVEAGAGWYAETPDDLKHIIAEVERGEASEKVRELRKAQQRLGAYNNDGLATDRVWSQMQLLLQ